MSNTPKIAQKKTRKRPDIIPKAFRYHSEGSPHPQNTPLQGRRWTQFFHPLPTTDYKQGGGWFICIRFALLCFAKLGCTSAQQNKKKSFFILLCIRFALTLLREVRLRLGRKNENFLIFILFFARLALTLHLETQRTDLAACNLSKIMLKLNVVYCAAKQCTGLHALHDRERIKGWS